MADLSGCRADLGNYGNQQEKNQKQTGIKRLGQGHRVIQQLGRADRPEQKEQECRHSAGMLH